MMMKDSTASIRARLLNLSKEQGLSFQFIIIRYLQERLLFRISQSKYRNKFYLKGGALIYAFEGSKTRYTLDIDLLGKEIANNTQTIKSAFAEIVSVPCPADGVWFNPETIQADIISEQEKYNGIRLYIDAGFHTIKQRMQVDIGFGDVIVPSTNTNLEYPVLLAESEVPVLLAYSTETLIAEKFQAMIELSLANSRMKDFYDVHKLIISQKYNPKTLEEAIRATFTNRNTTYTENHSLFYDDFFTDQNRVKMWKAFLNKIGQDKDLNFSEVGKTITSNLRPIWEGLRFQKV